jgi:hypothetical protein
MSGNTDTVDICVLNKNRTWIMSGNTETVDICVLNKNRTMDNVRKHRNCRHMCFK